MKDLLEQIIQDALSEMPLTDEQKDEIIKDIIDEFKKDTKCLNQ